MRFVQHVRKISSALMLSTILLGCGTAPTATHTTASPARVVQIATTVPQPTTLPPTAPPTVPPTPLPPTAAPTSLPATPTAETRAALAFPITTTFDLAAQQAALLPAFASDIDRAGEWNRYTIDGTLDPATRTLNASQRIEYTNRDSVTLDAIYLHLFPNFSDFGGRLDVSNVTVDGVTVTPSYEFRRTMLKLPLAEPLAPGASRAISFDFQTSVPANASRTKYGAFNKEAGVFALASAFPILAVVRGGTWDITRPDPKGDFVNSETALFDVTLRAPADWKLVTSGSAISYAVDAGTQTARFVTGPLRDFTLVAAQLQEVSAEVDGTLVTSYFRAENAAGGKVALDAAVASVRAFNKRFGPYPQRELDVVEINAREFLGVEYPGLTMIEHSLYTRPADLAITVAHEVGHMWFYSTVGNDVLRESWLDEAFASYAQIIYREETEGPAAAERELQSFRDRYLANRAAGRDAPVAQLNSAFGRNYVPLVYGKAVLFIQALRKQLGEQGFDEFLHRYYQDHRYSYVTGTDLVASANQTCGCKLDGLYSDWILKAVRVAVP